MALGTASLGRIGGTTGSMTGQASFGISVITDPMGLKEILSVGVLRFYVLTAGFVLNLSEIIHRLVASQNN